MDDFAPARTWTWNAVYNSLEGAVFGKQIGEFTVGEVIPLTNGPYLENEGAVWEAGDVCLEQGNPVDRDRDAVVPFRISVINTFDRPAEGVLLRLGIPDYTQNSWIESRSLVDSGGPDGTKEFLGCGKYGFDIGTIRPLATGESFSSAGFIVLRGYYAVEADGAGPRVFDDLILEIDPYGFMQSEGASGPGVVSVWPENGTDRFIFYVSGEVPPGG